MGDNLISVTIIDSAGTRMWSRMRPEGARFYLEHYADRVESVKGTVDKGELTIKLKDALGNEAAALSKLVADR